MAKASSKGKGGGKKGGSSSGSTMDKITKAAMSR